MPEAIESPVMDDPKTDVPAEAADPAGTDKPAENAPSPAPEAEGKPALTPEQLQAELESARAALKKANKEAESRRRRLEEIDAAEQAKRDAEKTEIEKARERAEAAEARAAALERERLIDRIAARHKLPDDLRDVLRGEDEEALEEHAKTLAKYVTPAKPPAPDIDAVRRGPGSGDLTEAERAELKKRFRI